MRAIWLVHAHHSPRTHRPAFLGCRARCHGSSSSTRRGAGAPAPLAIPPSLRKSHECAREQTHGPSAEKNAGAGARRTGPEPGWFRELPA